MDGRTATNLNIMNDSISQFTQEGRLIGLYVTIPQRQTWGAHGDAMLARILTDSLSTNSVRVLGNGGRVRCSTFYNNAFSLIDVDNQSAALKAIVADMASLDFLDGAHIAWMEWGEGVWMNEHPKHSPVPFESRIKWVKERMAEFKQIIALKEQLEQLIRDLSKNRPKDQP
jgi:hypothetical protein